MTQPGLRAMSASTMRSLKCAADLGTAVLIVFLLYAGRDVLIPFALSLLLAFLLSPTVNWFQKRGLSNLSSVFVTSAGLFALLIVGLVILGSSIAQFATDFPKYKGEVEKKIESVQATVQDLGQKLERAISIPKKARKPDSAGSSNEPVAGDESLESDTKSSSDPRGKERQSEQGPEIPWQSLLGNLANVFGPIGTAGLVSVFAIFMLVNRDDLRDRFVAVVSRGNYVVTTEAIAEASERISRYIIAQFLLNSSYGIIFGTGLWIIGMVMEPDRGFPNVMFLGVMAGLVRFLPYVGPLIGAGLPLLVSIALFPGYTVFFSVLVLIVVLELIYNNVLEPWLYGSRTGVSAIAVITAAVFWGWLWGAVGLLLATPLTVCLVVLGRYVPRLRFFVTLLSDEEQVPPSLRAYQRLLAGDLHKLREMILDQSKKKSDVELLDEILVPVSKRIQRQPIDERPSPCELTERFQSVLRDDSIASLFQGSRESVPGIEVAAIGSRSSIEGALLETFSKAEGALHWRLESPGEIPEVHAQEIVQINPRAVLLLSLPPGGMRQTLFWIRALRDRGYEKEIFVLRPGKFRRYDDLLVRVRNAGATTLLTSFSQTRRKLKSLATMRNPSETADSVSAADSLIGS
ncbi:AI-2E family transporter [Pirellulaceae bacterium SH501]